VIKRDTVAPSQMVWRFITAHTHVQMLNSLKMKRKL